SARRITKAWPKPFAEPRVARPQGNSRPGRRHLPEAASASFGQAAPLMPRLPTLLERWHTAMAKFLGLLPRSLHAQDNAGGRRRADESDVERAGVAATY